ncbi:ABC transporter ATP-binding protein [Frigoribacterium sp. VKM Ac-2836]|uniref:ABC transporter ATP-binding protein n=1 Tax=Frigoribacterium sp. VKM Ac-2836 TaxID=2739014 RepID=UPI00352D7420
MSTTAAPPAGDATPRPAVTAHGIALRHGQGPELFRDLSFHLDPGEVVAVCGPSGCGKSSLLSVLAGTLAPTAGTIDLTRVARTGWVFQNPWGVPGRSTLDHVVFPLLTDGSRRRDVEPVARHTLDRFGLLPLADRPFAHLSGGEAQRLMLARAVATRPDLLLVDEPTAQLDRRSAATVNARLRAAAHDGATVVVATHDPQTRESCTRVIELGPTDRATGIDPDTEPAPHAVETTP